MKDLKGLTKISMDAGGEIVSDKIHALLDPASPSEVPNLAYVESLIAASSGTAGATGATGATGEPGPEGPAGPGSYPTDVTLVDDAIFWNDGDTFYRSISSTTAFSHFLESNGQTVSVIVENTGGSDVTVSFSSVSAYPIFANEGALNTTVTAGKINVYTFLCSGNKLFATCLPNMEVV